MLFQKITILGGGLMKYREDKYGNKLSVLGFGCMRFKKKMGKINMKDAERQIMTAYNKKADRTGKNNGMYGKKRNGKNQRKYES